MKRSSTATLLLMSVAPLLLTACDDPAAQAQITQQPYPSVAACTTAGNPLADCQKAFDQAQANATAEAPHFKTREDCLKEFGPDMCQPRSDGGGGSFFMPMMTGFMLSRMLNGSSSSYTSAPLYRQRDGQDYRSSGAYAGGGFSSGGRSSWSSTNSSDAAGSRAITASRGGFGSASAARGGWGG